MRTVFRLTLTAGAILALLAPPAPAEKDKPADKTGTVSGKVVYQGQPLPGGTITFVPAKGKPVTVAIDADGNYKATAVPVGAARIAVETASLKPGRKPPKDKKIPGDQGGKYLRIPEKYGNPKTSGLTLEIQSGKQTHDIHLQK